MKHDTYFQRKKKPLHCVDGRIKPRMRHEKTHQTMKHLLHAGYDVFDYLDN
jgi:hypothetical protein